MGRVWTVCLILLLFTTILWWGVFDHQQHRKKFVLDFWLDLEMQIIKEAARATRSWLQIRIQEQGIREEIAEQEVLKRFIEPILLLKNGDAWIYNNQYVLFDKSSDFQDIYRNKTVREIFEIQKKQGAYHYDELCNGIINATDGKGWYVWLPEKGREFAAWTSVRLKDETWTIGLSTPESEILEHSGMNVQFIRELGGAIIITVLVFIIFFMILRQKQQDRYAMEFLEQQVKERTGQLEAANKELEAFSYTVSHSLRAPLRHIDGFCQILIEDYAEAMDEEGAHQLCRLQTCAQYMAHLIDDIQHISRIAREEIKIGVVNLSELAYIVAENLKQFEPERNVTFMIQDGVIVRGDKHLLKVVMEELIGNAWKFSSKKTDIRISFGMKEYVNNMTFYFVRDNGAGFDMAYVDKLFKPLGRLHHPHEFEGNGFGLAIVERIIQRHGGLVWGEGIVGEGAIFSFFI